MNRACVVALAACAAAGLLIAWASREPASAQEKAAPVVPKWEYKVVHVPVAQLTEKEGEAQFNQLGAEGWELSGTVSASTNRVNWGIFVFKRPRR
jgi:hypothetical protein